jgi:NAD(P)-dependent dehydrogenase (short-subunit alcohol dehydrogenase family)
MSAREHRVAVVTGATGGMGRVIALALAQRGIDVVTIARDPRRAEGLRAEIARSGGTLDVIEGDLSSRAGIIAATAAIRERHDRVHTLVNNAGAHFAERRLSDDGIEMHIAVDYLAAYGMTTLLMPQLRRGRARVVNVASDTLRDTRTLKLFGRPRPATLDLDQLGDLTALNPSHGFVAFEAYARAKLLTVTAGYALASTVVGEVTFNAVHPGIVATDIIDDLVPATRHRARHERRDGPVLRAGHRHPHAAGFVPGRRTQRATRDDRPVLRRRVAMRVCVQALT